jgi:hypothetical protein
MLTQERLKQLISYDKRTGSFTWSSPRKGVTVGKEAGCFNNYGFKVISVDGEIYMASHLVYLYEYGTLPLSDVDYRNEDKSDLRLSNLRAVLPDTNTARSVFTYLRQSAYYRSPHIFGLCGVVAHG